LPKLLQSGFLDCQFAACQPGFCECPSSAGQISENYLLWLNATSFRIVPSSRMQQGHVPD
ncbi:MAG TPA: hypothetical protein PLX97_13550, partial [Gemmatales bacterium]|nr:hypothetical protein [Gemmatales bacterium]